MPKMKTNKSVAGRFKLTAKKKLMRSRPAKRHLLTKKSSKRKRSLKKDAQVDKGLLKTYKHMMCVN